MNGIDLQPEKYISVCVPLEEENYQILRVLQKLGIERGLVLNIGDILDRLIEREFLHGDLGDFEFFKSEVRCDFQKKSFDCFLSRIEGKDAS